MSAFVPHHTGLEYRLPMSRADVEALIERLNRSPDATGDGGAFTVHTLDLEEAIAILEQVAAQMEVQA